MTYNLALSRRGYAPREPALGNQWFGLVEVISKTRPAAHGIVSTKKNI